MVPAVISGIFTLIGAFLGVFLSSISSFKLARLNRYDVLRRELNDFKIIVESLELKLPKIHSHDRMDTLNKAKLLSMTKKVKDEGLIENIEKVVKPTTISAIDIGSLKSSLSTLEYCLKEKKDNERIFDAYIEVSREIRRLKISLDVVFKY